MILSPAAYAEARRLLGLPEDAVLTIAQVYEAATIEVRSAANQRGAPESKPKE